MIMNMKKIFSMALACLIIVATFAMAIPTAAESAAFSVAKKDGTEVGSYATYNEALEAAFTAGGGTINMLTDYTLTATAYTDTDKTTCTDIVINGNGHTLTTEKQPFTFTAGDNLTVNNLKVDMVKSQRFVDILGGSTLTFNQVTFTSSAYLDDQYGHFRTPNADDVSAETVNTLNFKDCSITLTGKGTVIGIRKGAHILDVNMDGCTVTGALETEGQNQGGFVYGVRNVNLNNTNVKVLHRVFWDLKGGDTVRITGNSTIQNTSSSKFLISVQDDYDFILGENVKLIGAMFAEAKGTTEFLNIYAYNPNFYYTDAETAYPYFNAPVMNDGATLRVSAEEPNYGLRFTATCAPATLDNAETADVKESLVDHAKYGTVITKDTYLEKGLWAEGVQGKATDAAKGIFLAVEAKNGISVAEDGALTMNTALANIKDANLDSTFYARSYAMYSLDKYELINVYVFSELDTEKHGASYTDTINKTLAESVKDASEDGFTTEVSSYVAANGGVYTWVDGTKYTCYSREQYEALMAIAKK